MQQQKFSALALVAALVLSVPFASSAHAADNKEAKHYSYDDFGGARFRNNSHSALDSRPSDDIALAAKELNDIQPAAGSTKSATETESERELEKEFGAPVNSTVIDRGDSETLTRDSFGDGNVGVFYENNKDSRINDDQDAIGVEFRLLEFD